MVRTKYKTVIYLTGALVLFMFGIVYNGIDFPLSDSYMKNTFTLIPHLIFITLQVGWVISLQRRIINKRIRIYLIAVGLLMAFWLTVRTCKWFFVSDMEVLCRYLWYAFYIPMVLIPLIGVFITTYIGKSDSYKMPKWLNLFFIPAAALLVLIFTNDFHNLVFEFPHGIEFFNDDYTYGVGFYVTAFWFIALGFYFVTMLIIKSRVPGSKTVQTLPLVIMACAVVFWLLYSSKIINVDLTAVDCLIITLLLESAIQSGLIRSNTGYNELFEISTVAAQVVDRNYQTCYISAYADDYPEDVMKSAAEKAVDLGKTILHSKPVSGGYFLWQDDVKQIKSLMKTLEETQERLSENNFLLRAEIEIKEQKARFDEKNRLYDRIAQDVAMQLSLADDLIAQAEKNPESANKALAQVCVISAYIKRRSNLLLLGEENSLISAGELEFCLHESLDNLRLLGVFTSVNSSCNGLVSVENAVAVYDLFEQMIETIIHAVNAFMVNIKSSDGVISLSLQAGVDEDADLSGLTKLKINRGNVSVDIDCNDITVDILLPAGGEEYA